MSYYKDAAPINESHGIWLVQDQRNGKFYVRKTLTVFNKDIYHYLKDHPIRHTPRIGHVIEDGNTLVVIEDYIPGDTLEEILSREGTLPEAQVLDIALQLCAILRAFHDALPPIVNRDIKPSNIKLTEDGIVKLLDMNAAKYCNALAVKDTVLLGTQGYAAPEQYGFGASNAQTDIYAVGVLMNVLLTGKLPVEEKAAGRLRGIITKCTWLEPKQRYTDMDGLLAALSAVKGVREPLNKSSAVWKTGNTYSIPTFSKPCLRTKSLAASSCRFHQGFLSSISASQNENWRRFLPPGFRSGNLLLSLVSFVGYTMALYLCLRLQVADATPLHLLINRIGAVTAVLSCILYTGNYLNIQQRVLPPAQNLFLRILGIVMVDGILFLCVVMLVFLLDTSLP